MDYGAVRGAISEAEKPEAMYYASAFRERATNEDVGWALLAQIFDLHESFDDPREPFKPVLVRADGRRSFLPEDLTADQVSLLEDAVAAIDDPEFRSRVSDVLWLRSRDVSAARRAVDEYLRSALRLEDLDHWPAPADRYTRAFRLARQVDRRGPLSVCVAETLLRRLRFYDGDDPMWLTHRLISLLYEAREGDALELANIAQAAANRAQRERHWRRQRDYLDLAAKLLSRAGKQDCAEAARTETAKSFEAEAEEAEAAGGGLASHHHWTEALKAFRERPSLRAEVARVRMRLAEAGRQTLASMQTVSHEFDVSEIVQAARSELEGAPLDEALFKFVSFPLMDPSHLREEALGERGSVISKLFGSSHFDYEGRVVAVVPSALRPEDRASTKPSPQAFSVMHRSGES